MNPPKILILGVGNILLGDEGVGIHAVQHLQRMPLPPNVEVIDGGTGGFELIAVCGKRTKIIIIDAVEADAEPGSVFCAKPEDFALRWGEPLSAHHGGLRELLLALQKLSPCPEVVVFGIVPENITQPAMQLSPAVEARIPKILAHILDNVHQGIDAFIQK